MPRSHCELAFHLALDLSCATRWRNASQRSIASLFVPTLLLNAHVILASRCHCPQQGEGHTEAHHCPYNWGQGCDIGRTVIASGMFGLSQHLQSGLCADTHSTLWATRTQVVCVWEWVSTCISDNARCVCGCVFFNTSKEFHVFPCCHITFHINPSQHMVTN